MIEINFTDPFEQLLAAALTLASDDANVRPGIEDDTEFKSVVRHLYEAANGRQVETAFGLIAVAPPVAAFLKAAPFRVATRVDLLVEAATRILRGSFGGQRSDAIDRPPAMAGRGDKRIQFRALTRGTISDARRPVHGEERVSSARPNG